MPKNPKKSTVTVVMTWFSSDPVFAVVLSVVKQEMAEKKLMTGKAIRVLKELLPLNGNEPFSGYTEFGPHTHITFEAPSLAKGVLAATALADFIQYKFSGVGISTYFGGKSLYEAIGTLETAIAEAQEDLKFTRRFLPSKKIQALRLRLQELYS